MKTKAIRHKKEGELLENVFMMILNLIDYEESFSCS